MTFLFIFIWFHDFFVFANGDKLVLCCCLKYYEFVVMDSVAFVVVVDRSFVALVGIEIDSVQWQLKIKERINSKKVHQYRTRRFNLYLISPNTILCHNNYITGTIPIKVNNIRTIRYGLWE